MEYITIKFNDGENKYKISQLMRFCKLFDDLFGDYDVICDGKAINIPFNQRCFDNLLIGKVIDYCVIMTIKLENYLRVYNSVITADIIHAYNNDKSYLQLSINALDWDSFEKIFIKLNSNFIKNNFYYLAEKIVSSVLDLSDLSYEIFRICNISLLGHILLNYNDDYKLSLEQIQNQYVYWYSKYHEQSSKLMFFILPIDNHLIAMINKITNPLINILIFEYMDKVYGINKYYLIQDTNKIKGYIDNYLNKLQEEKIKTDTKNRCKNG